MSHLTIWGGAVAAPQTFDGFKAEHGIKLLELVCVSIDGHPVEIWVDEEGRLSDQWADEDGRGLHAIALMTDGGPITLVGPVLLTGPEFGPLPPNLRVLVKKGFCEPL